MRITDRVHGLKIPFQVTAPSGVKVDRFVHVHIIFGRRICLVDSGVAGSDHAIFDYIRDAGRHPREISNLILTHSHPDHIGAARSIKSVTGCTVHAHPAERMWIEDVELQAKERPVPGFNTLVGGSVAVDRALEGGNVLEADDGLPVEVIHTPGHSKGSISLRLLPEGVLITGDAVPVPGDIPIYEDVESLVRSIGVLAGLSGTRFLLASWDDPRQGDDIAARFRACAGYIQRVHDAVAKAAEPGQAPMDLCMRVVDDLGLPKGIGNPLLATTFMAHSRVSRRELFQA